jgi:hypothetical protein
MNFELHIRQIQEQLRARPTSMIQEELVLYKSLLAKGVRDEVYQTCLEQEIARRNQLWETVEL